MKRRVSQYTGLPLNSDSDDNNDNNNEDRKTKACYKPRIEMAALGVLFEHLPQHRIIVCRECGYAVIPTHVASHLHDRHKGRLTAEARRAIEAEARMLPDIATQRSEVVFPEPGAAPIEYLPRWDDGLRCERCRYVCRTLAGMQAHCKKEHGWRDGRGRGRATKRAIAAAEERRMWTTGVRCQQLFKTQGWQQLFEVAAPAVVVRGQGQRGGVDGVGDVELQQNVASIFRSTQARLKEEDEKAQAVVEPDTNRYVPQTWLRRTGWARHLAQFDRGWLAEMAELPAVDDDKDSDSDSDGDSDSDSDSGSADSTSRNEELARVCDAVQTVVWKAQKVSQPAIVGFAACCYVNRRETGETSNERPLNASQQGKTIEGYAEVWCKIVCYIWRTWELRRTPVGCVDAGESSGDEQRDVDSEDAARDRGPQGGTAREDGIRWRRPAYRLTLKQKDAVFRVKQAIASEAAQDDDSRDDGQEGSERDDWECGPVEAKVLELLIAMLDQNVGDDEYRSGIVSGLAVLGLDENCAWKGPSRATRSLSAVVTVSRMLVLYRAKLERSRKVREWTTKGGFSRATALRQAPAVFELVQKMVHEFMTLTAFGGKPTPMNWILMLRTYGLKVHYGTTADGVVDWVGDRLLYGHVSFSMSDLRAMIHGLVHTARIRLLRDLLLLEVGDDGVEVGEPQLPKVRMEELVDNAAEMRVGWNFIQDGRNTDAFGGIEGKSWVSNRVAEAGRLREEFIDIPATGAARAAGQQGPSSVVWRVRRIEQYRKALDAHRRDLLVLMHMTGGQPARGTEITTVRYKNGADGAGRGIFVEDGMMVYVVRYHKGVGFSGKEKTIHRYLPFEVGELLMLDLWLVSPFWRGVERASTSAPGTAAEGAIETGYSAFLWEPRPEKAWEGPRMRSKGRRAQKGRGSVQQPQRMSGLGLWDTNRVRKALQLASSESMGVAVNIMCWRHSSKAIYRRYIADRSIIRTINDADNDVEEAADGVEGQQADESNWQELGFHLQTGHGAQVGEGIYGRDVNESPFHTMARRVMFRKVSKEWHRFLLFRSALEEPVEQGTAAARRRRQAEEGERRRWAVMRKVNLQTQLERLLGAGTQFRGIQKAAIQTIMQQKSPVVAVMATGGGKSLLFMLPAFCSTGVTVVVVPLIMLRQDMVSRCKAAGIECVEWDSARPHEWAQMVFVTPEAAVGEAFGGFLNRQRAMGRLDRVVIDECHVVLDAGETGWRRRILALRELAGVETQMVYLTATMPPTDEPEFRRLTGLADIGTKEGEFWFRSRTSKPNVKYQIVWHDEKEEEAVLIRLLEEKKTQYGRAGQIIVYCDTVGKTKRYAKALGCQSFYRGVGDNREKERLLKALKDGTQQVWTATNALGLGVDAPSVRVIIHVGKVRKIRDYAQESGRAGRDGLACESIVLQGVRYDKTGTAVQQDRSTWGMEREMQEFIDTARCRRVVLDRVFDGYIDRQGCEEGEEACDNCTQASTVALTWEGAKETAVTEASLVEAIEEVYATKKTEEKRGTKRRQDEQVKIVDSDEIETEEMVVEYQAEQLKRKRRARAERESQQAQLADGQRLEEVIEKWCAGCVYCYGHEDIMYREHVWEDCTRVGEEYRVLLGRYMEEVKSKVEWASYSGCWGCGLPQGICETWQRDETNGRFKWSKGKGLWECQYRKSGLIEAIVMVWYMGSSEIEEYLKKRFQEQGLRFREGDLEEFTVAFIQWIGLKQRIGRYESNNACRILVDFG